MIRVTLLSDKKGHIKKFIVEGHSGYAASGSDIICSGVSAIAQTTIGALEELTRSDISYKIDEENAYLECTLAVDYDESDEDSKAAQIILKTFEIGCRQILESYGEKYIKIFSSSL